MGRIQIDNQLPLTPMPVLFRTQRIGEDTDYILKLSVTQQSSGSLDLCIYPYIGLQVSYEVYLLHKSWFSVAKNFFLKNILSGPRKFCLSD